MGSFSASALLRSLTLVLNSLTHQDFVPRSLSLLTPAGRFVELGKLKARRKGGTLMLASQDCLLGGVKISKDVVNNTNVFFGPFYAFNVFQIFFTVVGKRSIFLPIFRRTDRPGQLQKWRPFVAT